MTTGTRSSQLLRWPVLLLSYVLLALVFSIIQPLGRTPDEPAHVEYVKFLAENVRLPLWEEEGGGEAGYQAQHPPLYYALGAVVYRASTSFEERWRWHILRWATIAVGIALFFVCRRFFREALKNENLAFAATATVLLMPLTVLYMCYVNPDGLTMLWVTLALYLSWKTATHPTSIRGVALLGFVCGLAVLTKLSGLPAVVIAVAAHALTPAAKDTALAAPSRPLRLGVIVGAFLLTCGWWYGRSILLYGSPFVHTAGKLGTGLDLAARDGFWEAAKLTWRETFLSTWIQRGWLPAGFWEIALYGVIFLMVGLAAAGLILQSKRSEVAPSTGTDPVAPSINPLRVALNVSGLLIVLIFAGQQLAFWTTDVEFNAGGRYMIASMAGIALLLISGVAYSGLPTRFVRGIFGVWIGALLLMSLLSLWQIDTVLNPTYAPDWKMFHFPPEL